MRHLVLYVTHNTKGKKDGDEFNREAIAYSRYHNTFGHEVIMLPVPYQIPAVRRPMVVEANIRNVFAQNDQVPFDVFAFFGHGTERWIQTGHTILKIDSLVKVLAEVLSPCPVLWLASCRTGGHNPRPNGKTSRGFLEELTLKLHHKDFNVTGWGHTTTGHTTRNPNLALTVNDAYEIVTRDQRKELQTALWNVKSDLRFQIPLCSTIQGVIDRIEK